MKIYLDKQTLSKYKFLKDSKYFNLGMSEKTMLRRMSIEAILVEKYMNLLKKLSIQFPTKIFLFRPHPIENPNYWQIIFDDFKNIKVDQSGNLSEVLQIRYSNAQWLYWRIRGSYKKNTNYIFYADRRNNWSPYSK